eukprot:1245185-Rhodomonas_salina.2
MEADLELCQPCLGGLIVFRPQLQNLVRPAERESRCRARDRREMLHHADLEVPDFDWKRLLVIREAEPSSGLVLGDEIVLDLPRAAVFQLDQKKPLLRPMRQAEQAMAQQHTESKCGHEQLRSLNCRCA